MTVNHKKDDMGDVITDFYKSDAPQFKGKSKKKRREMAIAAKLSAEESFDIDPKKHRTARRDAKIGNLARKTTNPGEKAAAERKQKGPKLAFEVTTYSQRDKELKKTKKAMDHRHRTIHKSDPDGDINEQLTFEGWRKKAKKAVEKEVEKRDAGKIARQKLKDKEHHQYVNFLSAPEN